MRDTYFYFGSSLIATAGTAAAIYRSPAAMNLVPLIAIFGIQQIEQIYPQVSRGGFVAMGVSIAAMIGSSMIARSIPYTPGVGAKQAAWLAHCAVVGAFIAPFCLLGGPILTRAAWYTAGMVGGLSTVAVCAPSDKFLYMGGPLAMGLGVVFCASIASNFLPPTTALGAGMYSIAVYGGLVLVSSCHISLKVAVQSYYLFHTQFDTSPVWRLLALRHPESDPQGGAPPCPLWSSPL